MNLRSRSAESPSPFSHNHCLIIGSLLSLYLITRITHLTILPIFTDEAVYLHWAKLIQKDISNLWVSIEADNKKPLLIWFLVLSFKLFQDPLWAGRMVSVAMGAFSLLGVYLVGCKLYSVRTGQLAVLLYIFSPYHLFFDRMVYEASLINCFFIWTIWLTLSWLQKENENHFLYYGLLILVIGLSLLAQSITVLFVFLPIFFKLIFPEEKYFFPWRKMLPVYTVGVGIGILPYGVLYFTAEKFSVINYFVPTTHNLGQMGVLDLLARIPRNLFGSLDELLGYFTNYLTWPIVLLAFISFVWQFKPFDSRYIILLIYFLLPALILLGTAGKGFSRYYLFSATPFLFWSAQALVLIWDALKNFFLGKLVNTVSTLLLSVCIFPTLWFDYRLLTQPEKAPLTDVDRYQYISSRFSGYGIPEAIRFFLETAQEKKITVFTSRAWGNPADAMHVYLADHPNINVYMAYWIYERALLSPEVKMIAMRQPFTKKIFRQVQTDRLGDVYFIWRTSPRFSRAEFFSVNPNFQMVKAFKKPGSTAFVEIYKLKENLGLSKGQLK